MSSARWASLRIMDTAMNPLRARLDVLVGTWELTATQEERVMSRARTTFRRLGDGGFLVQRTDAPTFLVPDWEGAAPAWTESVFGLDDFSRGFTVLYADSRGVCRVYGMAFDDGLWTMTSRPGEDFHQRFEGTVAADGLSIDGRWEASPDGRTWSTDFVVTYRHLTP